MKIQQIEFTGRTEKKNPRIMGGAKALIFSALRVLFCGHSGKFDLLYFQSNGFFATFIQNSILWRSDSHLF